MFSVTLVHATGSANVVYTYPTEQEARMNGLDWFASVGVKGPFVAIELRNEDTIIDRVALDANGAAIIIPANTTAELLDGSTVSVDQTIIATTGIERCTTCRCPLTPDDTFCPECGAVLPGRTWDLAIEPMYPEEVTTTLDQAQHSDEYRAFVAERVKLNRDEPSDHYDAALDDLMGFCRTNGLSAHALIQRATTEAQTVLAATAQQEADRVAHLLEFAANNPAPRYAPIYSWANPEGN